ncbi:hypothetical protein KP509_24G023500 [Ceratopteris richardii]|uniref:Uncharacterized protein n=1 Tax=Ceratopteris richardii TaxID=49495 RepID=A0A8T2RT94_CERRI|nr:hypothetical protein KP509_24G023500 [Ceratopteris richardii]
MASCAAPSFETLFVLRIVLALRIAILFKGEEITRYDYSNRLSQAHLSHVVIAYDPMLCFIIDF